MPRLPSLDQAKAYIRSQLPHRAGMRETGDPHTGALFITISRQSGSGGPTVAAKVAELLNARLPSDGVAWTVFDQNLVEQVLTDQHLSPRLARYLPEDRVSEINASVGEIVGLHPNLWTLVERSIALMRELARRGHVVLVGRGANFATRSIPHGLHVRLVGSIEHRAQQTADLLGLSLGEARAHNRRVNAARRDFVRSVFQADVGDDAAYDLVINTGRLGHDRAARLIAGLASEHVSALPEASGGGSSFRMVLGSAVRTNLASFSGR